MAVSVDNLADAIAQELRDYREEVKEDLFESVEKAAKTCVTILKTTSPKDTGKYKKGWRKRKAFESYSDIRIEVYNATNHQLTHLLEDGHAKVGGGRVEGKPHIGPAAKKAGEILGKEVKMRLEMK